jgi:hypothetical protein
MLSILRDFRDLDRASRELYFDSAVVQVIIRQVRSKLCLKHLRSCAENHINQRRLFVLGIVCYAAGSSNTCATTAEVEDVYSNSGYGVHHPAEINAISCIIIKFLCLGCHDLSNQDGMRSFDFGEDHGGLF